MPTKIRLARRGRRKKPFYHIVIADSRSPRDGKFIEKIGVYNPMTKPATIELDRDAAFSWLMKGAQPTETARAILRFKGVLYRKHLQRGVSKGALTQEDADMKYLAWVEEKDTKVADRVSQEKVIKEELRKKMSEGAPKGAPAPAKEELEAFTASEFAQPDTAEAKAEVAEEVAESPEPSPVETEETTVESPAEKPESPKDAVETIEAEKSEENPTASEEE